MSTKRRHTKEELWMLQTQRASALLNSGIDYASRRLYLVGFIDEDMSARILPTFHLIDDSEGPVYVFINSCGGSVDDGFAIYDVLTAAQNRVITIGYGGVASMASLIFQAGSERVMAPNARFMIHNGSITFGEAVDLGKVWTTSKETRKTHEIYCSILAERSGNTLSEIKKMCTAETFLSAQETVAKGFADGILGFEKGKK
jgi:ATP-dependent Clp protease, protease subunit